MVERLEAVYIGEGKGALFAAIQDVLGENPGFLSYKERGQQLGMSEGIAGGRGLRCLTNARKLINDRAVKATGPIHVGILGLVGCGTPSASLGHIDAFVAVTDEQARD